VAWSTPTAQAAKQATKSIPIIAAVMADPVGDELVASHGRAVMLRYAATREAAMAAFAKSWRSGRDSWSVSL
jgi:hypothetical protein